MYKIVGDEGDDEFPGVFLCGHDIRSFDCQTYNECKFSKTAFINIKEIGLFHAVKKIPIYAAVDEPLGEYL
jgi:hypothetical protein